jgi:hypothetical protein
LVQSIIQICGTQSRPTAFKHLRWLAVPELSADTASLDVALEESVCGAMSTAENAPPGEVLPQLHVEKVR